MTESAFFQDLAMLMTVAGVVAAIFSRFGWPKVIGYILVGVLMNGYTWGGSWLVDSESVRTIGQLGVVFLMFAMGLSFSANEMKRMRGVVLPAAVLDTVVMIWLGYTVGTRLFGWGPAPSFFLGVAICDSATTLLAKVIDEMHWGNRSFAKYVLGTSVMEDIICVGAIAVATGFAQGGGMSAGSFTKSLGGLAVFFLTVIVVGFVLVPRLLKSVAGKKDDEALVLTMLGTCFLVSYFAYRFDFSLALGAFLVGIIGSTSQVRDRLSSLVDPLKSMFSAVFFISIGLLVDPHALWAHLPAILLVSAVVVVGKCMNCTVASLAAGLDVKTSVQIGFSLAQIGEFAFMVAILYAGIVGDGSCPMFQIAVGVSLLTTVLNPPMIRLSDRVGDFAERHLPAHVRHWHESYRAWIAKIGASENTPAFLLLKSAVIKLGIYAVLILALHTTFSMLHRIDFTRFSEIFERYDTYVFFILANVGTIAFLPLIYPAARAAGDEIAEMLTANGKERWRAQMLLLVRFVIVTLVLALFLAEWTMLNISLAPGGLTLWILICIILAIGVSCFPFFIKAGRRATTRFLESLTAEERREGLVNMTTVSLPEGVIHRFTLSPTSPAVGGTVGSLNIRAKTGASIVSVYRDGQIARNIGPEWEFQIDDTLVALGEPAQIAALKDLLGVM